MSGTKNCGQHVMYQVVPKDQNTFVSEDLKTISATFDI